MGRAITPRLACSLALVASLGACELDPALFADIPGDEPAAPGASARPGSLGRPTPAPGRATPGPLAPPGDEPGGEPDAGRVVRGSDGAAVWLPPEAPAGVTPVLSVVAPASGEVDGDLQVVSPEFAVRGAVGPLALALPVRADLLPAGGHRLFQPEERDRASGAWRPVGSVVAATGDVVQFDAPAASTARGYALRQADDERRFRIRIYLLSSQVTVTRPGSPFRVHYYPAGGGKPYSVMRDGEWNSTSGHASDPDVPDYVEDLHAALDEVYPSLIGLAHQGGAVFTAPAGGFDVYVRDTAGNAGSSPLGGPMELSAKRITSWQDMRLTAAHELVHVLQGQIYSLGGLFTGRPNRWFIEATANYLSARAVGLADEGKRAYYGEFHSSYLSDPLTSSEDNSMYAVGHFLDWIGETRGRTAVPDMLANRSANDILSVSTGLRMNSGGGGTGGIGSALEDFGAYLLTHPEGYAGFNRAALDQCAASVPLAAPGFEHIPAPSFNAKISFVTLDRTLKPLSMADVQLPARGIDDGLLVIAPERLGGSLLKTFTYDVIGSTDAAYAGRRPLDAYGLDPAKPLTLKAFGTKSEGIEQLLVNGGAASAAPVRIHYYVLRKPAIAEVGEGWAEVDVSGLGNLPADFLAGFDLYKDGLKLTGAPARPEAGATRLRIAADGLKPGDALVASVVDKYGHVWPEQARHPLFGTWKLTFSDATSNSPFMPVSSMLSSATYRFSPSGDAKLKMERLDVAPASWICTYALRSDGFRIDWTYGPGTLPGQDVPADLPAGLDLGSWLEGTFTAGGAIEGRSEVHAPAVDFETMQPITARATAKVRGERLD